MRFPECAGVLLLQQNDERRRNVFCSNLDHRGSVLPSYIQFIASPNFASWQ